MVSKKRLEFGSMFVFFLVWLFFTCITFGTSTPSGLFVPGMILGCCVGNLLSILEVKIGYID